MKLPLTLMTAALVGLAASSAAAQGAPGGREGFAERRMQMLFKDITLSPEQQTKVDSIRARYRAQMPAFTPGAPPDDATRQKMRDLMGKQNDEIRAVLTPDQQKVFDKNLAEMRARRPGGR